MTLPYNSYRKEAVGLRSSNYTLKITILVNMWNLGQFCQKIDLLDNNYLIKVQI